MSTSVAPISGASSVSYYIPVQPVRPVVPSQSGPQAAPKADEPPPTPAARAPAQGTGRLLDIRV